MSRELRHLPSDYVDGRFLEIPGNSVVSRNPAQPDEVLWSGGAKIEHVESAVLAARRAFPAWAARPVEERVTALRRWQKVTNANAPRIASVITDEMGKTLAESLFEAEALGGKVDITLSAHSLDRVSDYEVSVSATRAGFCRFKSHGVMSVIGPFNFPAHLANGHFVPALLMGNTIVFKPSEKTPGVGQMIAELMHEADLPAGVFNVVQGGADVASRLVNHDDIDGVLFTGSWPVGRRIMEANLDRPGRIIALEMGGNNPAVVLNDAHLKQAVLECVRAGFATTGQRCTCTRRIIVQDGIAARFINAFCRAAASITIGPGKSEPAPFMGPLATQAAAEAVIQFQSDLARRGAKVLLEARRLNIPGWFVSPGVVQVDRFTKEHDREVFGPLVQIAVVRNLDEAIEQANASQYGLATSIFTASDASYDRFFREVRCGCINRNNGTTGASSKLPFGGLGHSGNQRPAGAFSVDYCAYPVANMLETSNTAAVPAGVTWDDAWI